ncbi:MAG TPA: ectonucleotide pyrophosphatase/phosphodiesterase [Pyrinomonadaceae bacterium]|nr:ectonucleotide pyrophosphatase/phosphodiesterase [Pyrinomonadaceae bacterium]
MKTCFRLALFLLALFVFPAIAQKPIKDLKPTVILISLDGFRYDYLEKFSPPTLNKLARTGVRAKWMIPSFPTKTFPNHYTIATGLYPAHHGIVENNVYDFGTVFTMSKREEVQNPRWWLGEPIWVTAEKQGQIAASYFFVGTETKIEDTQPTFWRAWNGTVPPQMRVDKVLGWLDLPQKERPTMITLYFSDVDDAGHAFSPDAEETKYAVLNVDGYIERLVSGLKARKIDKNVNIIIVSDHGMAPVNLRNTTFLDDSFDFDLAEKILWTNEIVQIFPNPGKTDEIFSKINNLKHATCWKKADIPARLHYQDSPRIAPIVCSSEEGWMTTSHKRYEEWTADLDDLDKPRGAHGYDNRYQSMQATFIAHGAAFKRGFITEPFENIQVYNLMCRILGLTPAKNDGNLDAVQNMLK